MIAPHRSIPDDSTQDLLIAVRSLVSAHPCAASLGAETLSELLYVERWLPYLADVHEVESILAALRIDGEVLG
jgi:hypothetical protein